MKAFVIGFPKSGTTTLDRAFEKAGLRTLHWRLGDEFLGKIIYQSHCAGRDPLERFVGYDCITQADVCINRSFSNRWMASLNYWPNLDFAVLAAIRRHHPDCWMILNYRDPAKIQASLSKWFGFQNRIAAVDVPGLPKGYGYQDDEIINWINAQYEACRQHYGDDPRFFEYDIEDPAAPELIAAKTGIALPWWGKVNVGKDVHGKS